MSSYFNVSGSHCRPAGLNAPGLFWNLGLGAVDTSDAVSCLTQLHLGPSTSYFEILFVPVVRID